MEQAVDNRMLSRTYKYGNLIRLIYGGREYFDLLDKLIDEARRVIHLQVYIFAADSTGVRVADALIRAAMRGVKVYLLVDGYASQGLSHGLIQRLKEAGVIFEQFEPIFRSKTFYFGRRMHHKVIVVDSHHALVGGINIADRYNSVDEQPPWLDMALYVKGVAANELEHVCCNMWNDCTTQVKVHPQKPLPVGAQVFPRKDLAAVRVRINDWVKRKKQIRMSYTDLFANAREEIIVACSYFLPSLKIRKLMSKAVKRGVVIKVIVAGPSDVMIAKHAERFLYRWMLQNHIRVYEYQKSVLHAKLGIADGRRMTVGSYNVNNISAYASIELNLDVRNKPFVAAVKEQLNALIEHDCLEIAPDYYRKSGWLKRIWQRICYGMIKVILYLFTFYFKQEKIY